MSYFSKKTSEHENSFCLFFQVHFRRSTISSIFRIKFVTVADLDIEFFSLGRTFLHSVVHVW